MFLASSSDELNARIFPRSDSSDTMTYANPADRPLLLYSTRTFSITSFASPKCFLMPSSVLSNDRDDTNAVLPSGYFGG
jgi:hypothetical protein